MSAVFLGPGYDSQVAYSDAIAAAHASLIKHYATLEQCYSGSTPQATASLLDGVEICPEQGQPLERVLDWVGQHVLRASINVTHPRTMAHLHCPPLIPALAAEQLIAATNQSMDSWDQAPAATHLEQGIVEWLGGALQMGAEADGIFTSGGTQSNFMALLLARDVYARRELNWSIQEQGLPPQAPRLRILCSELAHFSVQKSAAILGLGYQAVVPVKATPERQIDVAALASTLARLKAEDALPFAIVATAGTTDYGSIDPLHQLADLAAQYGVWLHVDAAYGGALALSRKYGALLDGIGRADSVTVDFHKLFFQPISCSALMIRRRADWEVLRYHADYLNPEENEEAGVLDLVTKSIQTTRRFDGLKVFVTMQALGRSGYAALIDGVLDLAQQAGELIEDDAELELAAPARLASVVFRYVGKDLDPASQDRINTAARRSLLMSGTALIGFTKVDGRNCVKFTLMNPQTTLAELRDILAAFKAACRSA